MATNDNPVKRLIEFMEEIDEAEIESMPIAEITSQLGEEGIDVAGVSNEIKSALRQRKRERLFAGADEKLRKFRVIERDQTSGQRPAGNVRARVDELLAKYPKIAVGFRGKSQDMSDADLESLLRQLELLEKLGDSEEGK